jgi:glycosyltransferase involved in cell wall biosynthesis
MSPSQQRAIRAKCMHPTGTFSEFAPEAIEMDSGQAPLVSIIIPTYNAAEFVAQAVQSVLEQAYRHYELIVVDDGSTDDTKGALQAFDGQIRYLYQPNRGPSAARNAGIRIARGQYICFLDADDWWVPNKLEAQVDFITGHCNIGLVFSDAEEVDAHKVLHGSLLARSRFYPEIMSQTPIQEAFRKLLGQNFITTSTVMVRRECFVKAGLFDESLRVCEDTDMWLRIAANFGIAALPLIVGWKRAHSGNISRNTELMLRCRIKVWKHAQRRFPEHNPAIILNPRFANTHLQLGRHLLLTGRCKEARQEGLRSLSYAVRHVVTERSLKKSIPNYRWSLALALIPLTLMGWSAVQALWRLRNSPQRRG